MYSLQDNAGIAQLVERHLAKVEVASSSLVSRSKFQKKPSMIIEGFFYFRTEDLV